MRFKSPQFSFAIFVICALLAELHMGLFFRAVKPE